MPEPSPERPTPTASAPPAPPTPSAPEPSAPPRPPGPRVPAPPPVRLPAPVPAVLDVAVTPTPARSRTPRPRAAPSSVPPLLRQRLVLDRYAKRREGTDRKLVLVVMFTGVISATAVTALNRRGRG
ncbi:hypothetical protein [Streptosporangium sp. NPDC002524]|uniref:hypothetical protein n=1 Tax=Streptosporangium sp. NPDC002524 TaxID=3154537 RepID=UPI00331EAA46